MKTEVEYTLIVTKDNLIFVNTDKDFKQDTLVCNLNLLGQGYKQGIVKHKTDEWNVCVLWDDGTEDYMNNNQLYQIIAQSPNIKLSKELADELGYYDVEELADRLWLDSEYQLTSKSSFIKGFNKNQELRGFSLRDMERCWENARDYGWYNGTESPIESHEPEFRSFEEFIQHLQQPKQIKVTATEDNGVYHLTKAI
jgi:hypothetical protein